MLCHDGILCDTSAHTSFYVTVVESGKAGDETSSADGENDTSTKGLRLSWMYVLVQAVNVWTLLKESAIKMKM